MNFWVHKWKRDKETFNDTWFYIMVTLNVIWFKRNKALWEGEKACPTTTVKLIENQVSMFLCSQSDNCSLSDNSNNRRDIVGEPAGNGSVNVFMAINLIKVVSCRWIVAVAVDRNGNDNYFAQSLSKENASISNNLRDMLEFLRSCLLEWDSSPHATLFIFPPLLFKSCKYKDSNRQLKTLVRDIQQLVNLKEVVATNGKFGGFNWNRFHQRLLLHFVLLHFIFLVVCFPMLCIVDFVSIKKRMYVSSSRTKTKTYET